MALHGPRGSISVVPFSSGTKAVTAATDSLARLHCYGGIVDTRARSTTGDRAEQAAPDIAVSGP